MASASGNKVITEIDSVSFKRYKEGFKTTPLHSPSHQLYLDSLLSLQPDNAYYWQQKSMPLYKERKYELGRQYVDSAVKFNEKQYLDYRAFLKCIFEKSYRAALEDFELVKQKTGFAFVMGHSYDFYMGLCYLQLNNFDKADSLIQYSLTWNEKNSTGGHYLEYFYLGVVKMEKNETDEALENFDKALQIYTQFPDALYFKSVCLEQSGKKEEALAVATKGLTYFNQGYTNNEDNVFYEDYPYQQRRYSYESRVNYLGRK